MDGMFKSSKCLVILFIFINMLNYLDRGYLAGMNKDMMEEFNITNTQSGLISSAFMIGFIASSLLYSYLVYNINRIILIISGLTFWVISTLSCGINRNIYSMFIVSRIFTGIGEASFISIAPPFIDDYMPKKSKSTWLSLFYLASPVGYAFGFLLSGVMCEYNNCHNGFYIESFIMFLFTGFLFCFQDIEKHLKEKKFVEQTIDEIENTNIDSLEELTLLDGSPRRFRSIQKKGIITSTCKRIGLIFRNPLYILIIIGYIFYTAITGAFSYWAPVFLSDTFGKDIFQSDLIMGGITVGTGIIGTILGGFLLDINKHKMKTRIHTALSLCIVFSSFASIFTILIFISDEIGEFIPLMIISQLLLFMILAPVNSLIMWTVEKKVYDDKKNSQLKTLGCSICTLLIHVFGDVPSPIIVGKIQDVVNNWEKTMLYFSFVLLLTPILWGITYFVLSKKDKLERLRVPILFEDL